MLISHLHILTSLWIFTVLIMHIQLILLFIHNLPHTAFIFHQHHCTQREVNIWLSKHHRDCHYFKHVTVYIIIIIIITPSSQSISLSTFVDCVYIIVYGKASSYLGVSIHRVAYVTTTCSSLHLYLHTNITVHTIVCTYTMTIHTYLFTSYESSLSIAERFTVQTSYYCMLTRLLWKCHSICKDKLVTV